MKKNKIKFLIIENDSIDFNRLKQGLENYYLKVDFDKDISFLPVEEDFETMYDCVSNIVKDVKSGSFFENIKHEVDFIIIDMELLDKKIKSGLKVYRYLLQNTFKEKMPPTLFVSRLAKALNDLDNLPNSTSWAPKKIADEKIYGELAIKNVYEEINKLINRRSVHG